MGKNDKELVSLAETAGRLGVSVPAIRQRVYRGETLKTTKVGRRVYVLWRNGLPMSPSDS